MKLKQKKIVAAISIVLFCAIISFCIYFGVTSEKLSEHFPAHPFTFQDNDYEGYVTKDFECVESFMVDGKKYDITWSESSNYINDGVVTRPQANNEHVTMKATIKYGLFNYTHNYEITLIKNEKIDINIPELKNMDAYYEGDTLRAVNLGRHKIKVQSIDDAKSIVKSCYGLMNISDDYNFEFVQLQNNLVGKTYLFKQKYQDFPVGDGFVTVTTKNDIVQTISWSVYSDEEYIIPILSESSIREIIKLDYDYNIESIVNTSNTIWAIVISYCPGDFMVFDYVTIDTGDKSIISSQNVATQDLATWDNPDINALIVDEFSAQHSKEIYSFADSQLARTMFDGKGQYKTNLTFATLGGDHDKTCEAHFRTITDWYREVLGRDMIDNLGSSVNAITQVGWFYDNGLYHEQTNTFIFCEKSVLEKPMSSVIDTVSHEYSHAVFSSMVGGSKISTNEYLAILESYGDTMTCLMTDDWVFGEEFGIANSRDYTYSNPDDSFDEDLPSNYKKLMFMKYNAYENSALLTQVAYSLSSKISNKQLSQIWYQSMAYGYNNCSTYETVKNNVVLAAQDLGHNERTISLIKEAFEAYGI